MDKKAEQLNARVQRLTPPMESHVSTILNGVGNGMMVGSVPFVGMKLYTDLVDKPLTKGMKYAGAFVTVASCVVGALYGKREAHRLQEYRQEVNDEIVALRNDVDEAKSWSDKVSATPRATENAR